MAAKAMLRLFPSGNVVVMILTADGRQKEIATPAKALKMISCSPDCERPQARVNPDCKTHPVKYIGLLPTTSEIEPSRRSVQPQVNA
jgi:hypothetical protein